MTKKIDVAMLTKRDIDPVWINKFRAIFPDGVRLPAPPAVWKFAGDNGLCPVLDWFYRTSKASEFRPNLEKCNLMGAQWTHAGLSFANMRRAEMNSANFRMAAFAHADLAWANASDVNMYRVDAFSTNMAEIDLDGAKLAYGMFYYATLIGARMQRVDARWANFYSAQLDGADMRNADLRGANFNAATLERANLVGAVIDDTTILPEGFDWGAFEMDYDGDD